MCAWWTKSALDLLEPALHLPHRPFKDVIKDNGDGVRVVEDVLGLRRRQPEVDRDGHRAGLDRPVEGEYEEIGVEHPEGNLVALLHPCLDQGVGDGIDPLVDLPPAEAFSLVDEGLLFGEHARVACDETSEIHTRPP
jgi:hypothetical protein